jgi:hypothetical protein
VWATIKREYRFVQYRLLTPDVYVEVCKYLRKWIARYSAKPAGDKEERRKRFLKRIHAEARKRRGAIDKIHAYASDRWSASSLADLAPEQLAEIIGEFGL